jgi:sec-independent protein translocase protein TatA
MGEIGIEKILLLLLIILLLFGAKRLPEFGRSLGKGIREFKGSLSGVKEAINEAPQQDQVNAGRAETSNTTAPTRSETTGDQTTREPRRLIG